MRDLVTTWAEVDHLLMQTYAPDALPGGKGIPRDSEPLSNVWFGVSVEDQKTADERIPLLLQTPAAVRWISYEPALGPVNLRKYLEQDPDPGQHHELLDWVVCGGESGPKARPMHPEWARAVRDQCQANGVPVFFKQWGAWVPHPAKSFRPRNRAGKLHELRVHRLTEFGEVNSVDWEAYPASSKDDAGPIDVLEEIGHGRKCRLLDGREWNEFPATATAAVETAKV
jgi:hypothetical protein